MGADLGGGLTEIEARWMRDQEWARTAADALDRRSKIGLHLTADQRAAFEKGVGRARVIRVAALYRFARFPDPAALREPLLDLCAAHGVKGTLLLASEGINGTIAGPPDGDRPRPRAYPHAARLRRPGGQVLDAPRRCRSTASRSGSSARS